MGELAKEIHTVSPCEASGQFDDRVEMQIEMGDTVDTSEVYQ